MMCSDETLRARKNKKCKEEEKKGTVLQLNKSLFKNTYFKDISDYAVPHEPDSQIDRVMKKSKVLGRKNSILSQIRVTGTCKQQQRVKKHQQTKANSNNYRTRPDSLIDRVMEKSKVLGRKNSIVSQIMDNMDLPTHRDTSYKSNW